MELGLVIPVLNLTSKGFLNNLDAIVTVPLFINSMGTGICVPNLLLIGHIQGKLWMAVTFDPSVKPWSSAYLLKALKA